MSQLVDLYNTSDKKRPKESRERIPKAETDYFDREHKFSDGFSVEQKRFSPTNYTEAAQDHYQTEVENLTPPQSYDPAEPLHRYTPETPFHDAGAGDTSKK
jgi:hypothetical protein